jgi:hypothetical protein
MLPRPPSKLAHLLQLLHCRLPGLDCAHRGCWLRVVARRRVRGAAAAYCCCCWGCDLAGLIRAVAHRRTIEIRKEMFKSGRGVRRGFPSDRVTPTDHTPRVLTGATGGDQERCFSLCCARK